MTDENLRYYDLETYLFRDVHDRFEADRRLNAFDLFSIIIWKANRAKSKLAHRLLAEHEGTLEEIAVTFTEALAAAPTSERRFLLTMLDYGFYLPMASAILTVLWPKEFTVYDVRLCEELGEFANLGNLTPKNAWPKYQLYCAAVANHPDVRGLKSLRDKDRSLWGRSAANQLREDIKMRFDKPDIVD